jgi:hypothetical protein
VETILTAVAGLNRHLTAARQAPFRGRRPQPHRCAVRSGPASQTGDTELPSIHSRRDRRSSYPTARDFSLSRGWSRVISTRATVVPGFSSSLIARAEIAEFEQQVVADLTPRFEVLTDTQLATLADLISRLEIP